MITKRMLTAHFRPVTVSAAPAFMSCPASAGAAETANGAVERMVLLGLTRHHAKCLSKTT